MPKDRPDDPDENIDGEEIQYLGQDEMPPEVKQAQHDHKIAGIRSAIARYGQIPSDEQKALFTSDDALEKFYHEMCKLQKIPDEYLDEDVAGESQSASDDDLSPSESKHAGEIRDLKGKAEQARKAAKVKKQLAESQEKVDPKNRVTPGDVAKALKGLSDDEE